MGRQRRRLARAQPRPLQHAGHDAERDRLAHRREAEGQVALRVHRDERVRRVRLDADRARRHRLPAGPELERLRARPLDGEAALEARVQRAERRPERRRLRLGAASTARRRRRPSRSIRRRAGCCGRAGSSATSNEGIDMAPQLYDGTVLAQHRPEQRRPASTPGGARHRLGARRRDRQAEVDVQHRLGRRQAVGQPDGQQRRRPLVSAGGRQPGARLHLRRQPGAALRHEEVPERLEPPGPEPLHELARRARRQDGQAAVVPAGRRRTTCATTT